LQSPQVADLTRTHFSYDHSEPSDTLAARVVGESAKGDDVRTSVLMAICAFGVSLSAQESFAPAQYQSGSVPSLPVMAVGGGQVMLEVTVGSDGRVTDVKPLRTTPPFTEMLTESVRTWRFRPAEDAQPPDRAAGNRSSGRTPVEAKVLVAGLFRPPALTGATLGESSREGAPASDATPFPLTTTLPGFPPQANRGGVVLLEARVDRGGEVRDMKVLRSSPPFDEAARGALSGWVFRPARVHGADAASLVYVILGFAAPVSNGSVSQ
jgi:TonB family protein